MSEGFHVTEPVSGAAATARLPGPALDGDPELCARLRPFLNADVIALTGSRDPRTGERGTAVRLLPTGSPEWLEECLGRAAVALGLRIHGELP